MEKLIFDTYNNLLEYKRNYKNNVLKIYISFKNIKIIYEKVGTINIKIIFPNNIKPITTNINNNLLDDEKIKTFEQIYLKIREVINKYGIVYNTYIEIEEDKFSPMAIDIIKEFHNNRFTILNISKIKATLLNKDFENFYDTYINKLPKHPKSFWDTDKYWRNIIVKKFLEYIEKETSRKKINNIFGLIVYDYDKIKEKYNNIINIIKSIILLLYRFSYNYNLMDKNDIIKLLENDNTLSNSNKNNFIELINKIPYYRDLIFYWSDYYIFAKKEELNKVITIDQKFNKIKINDYSKVAVGL